MSRVHHEPTMSTKSSNNNKYRIQERLESYKLSHHLIQEKHKQFTLGIFFKLHTSSRVYEIFQV
jgi:hypothetical protein